jgi:hypothetical protein
MEEESQTTKEGGTNEGELGTALHVAVDNLPTTEFVKVEKNLASLGFFTPSSNRLRNTQEKSFIVTTVADGKRTELKGTIIPSAKYGLPITADQDKWIALCKILNDIMQKEGVVTNPVSFTSAEILRLLRKHGRSGKNYREIEEWLDVLFSTTIFSEGVVYLANEKRRVKDRFRVFDRAVSFGKELSDGKIADKNYVWLSEWQLQNINSNHLLPIDLEAYRQLKNHIAKALVPLLQVWLYATRTEGVYEKRYYELCQMLNIRQHRFLSAITRILAPSLDELTEFGHLSDWKIEKTSDGQNYKIIFYHGEKFHRDRRTRLNKQASLSPNATTLAELHDRKARSSPTTSSTPRQSHHGTQKNMPPVNETFLAELMKRGVAEPYARTILAAIHPRQPVLAQLEWGDQQVRQSGGKILNPAGFFMSLVSGNVMPPPNFETAVQRNAREAKLRAEEEAQRAQQDLETEYEWYRARQIDAYIASLDPNEVAAMIEAKRREYQEEYEGEFMIDSFSKHDAKRELGKRAPLMTMEEFKASRENSSAFSLKPVSEPVVSDDFGAEPDLMPIETGVPEPATTRSTDFVLVPESREVPQEEPSQLQPPLERKEEKPVIELAAKKHEPGDVADGNVTAEAA